MSLQGCFGIVPFTASRAFVNTFTDFKVDNKGRWAEHHVHLQMPILEFTGPGLTEVKFKMKLSTQFNNDPILMLTILRLYMLTAFVAPLLVGNRPVTLGFNLFVLTDIGEEHKFYDARGNLFCVDVEVTLKEYRLLM